MTDVIISRSATSHRDAFVSVLTEFAERINRPVLVTANHRSNSMTVAAYAEEINNALAQASPTTMGHIQSGNLRPYVLNFFSTPILNIDHHVGFSDYYLHPNGSEIVLDYHVNRRLTSGDGIDDLMTQYAHNLSALDNTRIYHEIGKFLYLVDDDYIQQSSLGTLRRVTDMYESGAFVPGAIVCENAAFMPRDIVHGSNAVPILQALLDMINLDVGLSPEERAAREADAGRLRAEANERRIENAVDGVRRWAVNLSQVGIRTLEDQMQRYQADAMNYRRHLTELSEKIRETMVSIETQRSLSKRADPGELKSLRKIMRKGIITNLNTRTSGSDPILQFFTRPLLMLDERTGAYHLLGSMKVEINMRRAAVNAWNQDRTVNGYTDNMQAPHIFSEGNPCYGNFADAAAGFVANGDWYSAIELTLAFLESANTEDPAGAYVHKWPFVAEPERYGYPAYIGKAPEPYTKRMPRDPDPEPGDEDYDGDYDGEREDDEA